jgi:predicted nucleic acid-binding protein
LAAGIELPQFNIGDFYLAATALTHDLTLVTGDEQRLDCKSLKTLSND